MRMPFADGPPVHGERCHGGGGHRQEGPEDDLPFGQAALDQGAGADRTDGVDAADDGAEDAGPGAIQTGRPVDGRQEAEHGHPLRGVAGEDHPDDPRPAGGQGPADAVECGAQPGVGREHILGHPAQQQGHREQRNNGHHQPPFAPAGGLEEQRARGQADQRGHALERCPARQRDVQPLRRSHLADQGRGDDDGQQEPDALQRPCGHQQFRAGGGRAERGGGAEQNQAGDQEAAEARPSPRPRQWPGRPRCWPAG